MVPCNVIMEKKSKMSATAGDSLTWDYWENIFKIIIL